MFGVLDGCDDGLKDEGQEKTWEEWFHDCSIDDIAEYYQLRPEEGVIV